jgi:hypothetical protein
MPWHRVIIKHSEEAHLYAQGLMIPFMQQYKEAGTPEGATVYINRDDFGNRIYYFSSPASSLAQDLLQTFHATRCSTEPDLERFRKIRL